MKNQFFKMFGGPEKFDLWLTQTAEILAKPISLPPLVVPFMMPGMFQLDKPHEMLDWLIEQLEQQGVWEYTIRRNYEQYEIIDGISGHIVETISVDEPDLDLFLKKYGIPL